MCHCVIRTLQPFVDYNGLKITLIELYILNTILIEVAKDKGLKNKRIITIITAIFNFTIQLLINFVKNEFEADLSEEISQSALNAVKSQS